MDMTTGRPGFQLGQAIGMVAAGLIMAGCGTPPPTQGAVATKASASPTVMVSPSPSPVPSPSASPAPAACVTGGLSPSPGPSPKASPAATVSPSGASGAITGSAGYVPPTGVAPQLVYAISTAGPSHGAYATEIVAGQYSYSIKGVAPGAYYVYTAVRPLVCKGQGLVLGASYSAFMKCGGDPKCAHGPIPVIVTAGASTDRVDPGDWYTSNKTVPAPPIEIVHSAPQSASKRYGSAREAAVATASAHAAAMVVDGMATCPVNRACITVGNQHDGTQAAYFDGEGGSNGERLACLTYVVHDPNGWRGVRSQCPASTPVVGQSAMVWLGGVGAGCGANVRSAPGPSGKVVGCLQHHTRVSIDAGPVYVPMSSTDGIWWHLASKGWMADNFLIYPETCGCD